MIIERWIKVSLKIIKIILMEKTNKKTHQQQKTAYSDVKSRKPGIGALLLYRGSYDVCDSIEDII